MDDHDIVELYWLRDENAILFTAERYETYLSTIAYHILYDREDTNESINDTYLAAWNSIPPHKPSILSTYLGKLTRRISIDRLRYKHRDKRGASEYTLSLDELSECIQGDRSAENEFDNRELGEAINIFLRTLSTDARHLFIGRYYFLDPLKDVAAYCGMSESKAKTILFRTRKKLKLYLQKEGFEI